MTRVWLALMSAVILTPALLAAGGVDGAVEKQGVNVNAIVMFLAFVALTLFITYWAAKRTKSAKDFYAAGGGITGLQNGLAIAGDYMSAASFLGISALVYTSGFDGLIYSIGFLVGWPIILFLIAEPLRNLGKYTFADVASFRLQQKDIRVLAALGTIVTATLYLIAQMVGAGKLIQLLFGMDYITAVVMVGALMILYVAFGGMLATTWIQIIKAILLLSGATFIALMVLNYVGFSFETMFAKATAVHAKGDAIMEPGGLVSDPINAISLGIALMFGTAGLPHILMRFFTVGDAKEARKSVFYATGFIGYFYILTFIIGFGAIVLLSQDPHYFKDGVLAMVNGVQTVVSDANASQILVGDKKAMVGGENMTAIHLSAAVGGDLFLGFISAVAFATILAVVAGLTLSGASAISHDLYATLVLKGKNDEQAEVRVSRIATIIIGIVAILLGIAFEKQNIAFMVGLAFAVAASVNFPILLLSIYWRKLTTRGAVWGGTLGLVTAVVLVVMSPTVWGDVLGHKDAAGKAVGLIGLKNPAIFSVTIAFLGAWFFSITDRSERAKEDEAGFEPQYIRAQTGIGAEGAVSH